MTRDATRQQIEQAIDVLKKAPLREVQRLGYHFQPRDFYSPLNDCDFLHENPDLWRDRELSPSLQWDAEAQLDTARTLAHYVGELADVPVEPPPDRVEFCWSNDFWNAADALVHYGLLRSLQPGRVVEIGCGWSSLLMKQALERNDIPCDVTLIEPYPNPQLFDAFPDAWTHHQCILQRAPREIFSKLGKNDICFYDGSHCVKTASDVNWFFFEILPELQPGVLIHIHDIFLPDDYPDEWIFNRGQSWNEQFFVQAFLTHNVRYEVVIANRFLWRQRKHELDQLYRGVQPSCGCSLWLRKLC